MKYIYSIVFLIFIGAHVKVSFGQKHNIGVGITPEAGFLLVHRQGKMSHLLEEHVYGVNLGINIQTNGTKQWHHDFLFPQFFVNASYKSLGNKEVLGEAYGIEGGYYLPIKNKHGWTFGPMLSAGIAFVTKCYDTENNPKNNAIGSHINSMVNVGFKVEKQFKQQQLGLTLRMTHLSNGAVRLPNLGLNMPVLGVSYTYFFDSLYFEHKHIEDEVVHKVRTWAYYSQLIASTKQIYPTGGSNYGVVAMANYAQYKWNRKFAMEVGLDVLYNQSIRVAVAGDWGKEKNIQAGVYGAFVIPIHRFQLYGGMGVYVINSLKPDGMVYHRLGGRFKLTNRLWGNISIKAHWGKADYFEYGIAYRWK